MSKQPVKCCCLFRKERVLWETELSITTTPGIHPGWNWNTPLLPFTPGAPQVPKITHNWAQPEEFPYLMYKKTLHSYVNSW